jgi:phage replication O-like protein O
MKTAYTRVPNRLLEEIALSRRFSERTRVLCVVLRKTFGWGKGADRIALGQFVRLTGMKKPNVCRALRQLAALGLVVRDGALYKISPKYAQEMHIPSTGVIKADNGDVINPDNGRYPSGQSALSKRIPTKETITKETYTKERRFQKETFQIPPALRRRLDEIAASKAFPDTGETALLNSRAGSGGPRASTIPDQP